MGKEVKYKVVYKAYGHWTEQKFSDLELAYECAVRTNGIVLNAKAKKKKTLFSSTKNRAIPTCATGRVLI